MVPLTNRRMLISIIAPIATVALCLSGIAVLVQEVRGRAAGRHPQVPS